MATAKITFPGSTKLTNTTFSTDPGSAYLLTDLRGWKENPTAEWETYPKWNGRGSFVSKRATIPSRTVELEASIIDSTSGYRALLEDLGRLGERTDITLTVTEGTVVEKAFLGYVANPRTWNQIGSHVLLTLNLVFANPFILNTTTSTERL